MGFFAPLWVDLFHPTWSLLITYTPWKIKMEPEIHPFEQEKTSFHQTSEAWGSICQISRAWNLLTVPKMCKLPPGRFKHSNGSGWSILVFSIFFFRRLELLWPCGQRWNTWSRIGSPNRHDTVHWYLELAFGPKKISRCGIKCKIIWNKKGPLDFQCIQIPKIYI